MVAAICPRLVQSVVHCSHSCLTEVKVCLSLCVCLFVCDLDGSCLSFSSVLAVPRWQSIGAGSIAALPDRIPFPASELDEWDQT